MIWLPLLLQSSQDRGVAQQIGTKEDASFQSWNQCAEASSCTILVVQTRRDLLLVDK